MLTHEDTENCQKEGITLDEFESAFKMYYSVLYKYAFSFTKEEAQAKDIVSDVFLLVWTNRARISMNLSTKSYLFAMVKNQALKHMRNDKSDMKISGDYFFGLPTEQPCSLEKYLTLQSAHSIENLISQLPKLRQEIIELKLFGLKNREIAQALGLTEKKVEYQLGQAIEVLRYQLRKAEEAAYCD